MTIAPKQTDFIGVASHWGTGVIHHLQELLKPLPYKKNIGFDLASLFLLSILQYQLIPLAFGTLGIINLFIPWVGLYLIRDDHMFRCCTIISIASILMETHSSTPAGMYFVGFIIFYAVLILVKHQFSWDNYKTWILFMGCLNLCIGSIKWVTLFIIDYSVARQFAFSIFIEVISSFTLGVLLIFYQRLKTSDQYFEGGEI